MDDRTLIAAMAMQGGLMNSGYHWTFEQLASDAVILADTLLAELAKKKPKPMGDGVPGFPDDDAEQTK